MGCHVSTSIDGSPVTATMVLTVWSRGHGGRIPILGALPRRWRSGSSCYVASSPLKVSITGRRRSAGILNNSTAGAVDFDDPSDLGGSWTDHC